MEELINQVDTNLLNMKNRDPDSRKQLIFSCEDELFKYKKKLFPKSQNNMGEGFS